MSGMQWSVDVSDMQSPILGLQYAVPSVCSPFDMQSPQVSGLSGMSSLQYAVPPVCGPLWYDIGILISPEWRSSKLEERKII